MTDFFSQLTNQVLHPSTEVVPVSAGLFALGPDVPASGLLPEPPALDFPLRAAPAALADRRQSEPTGKTLSDPPVPSTALDVETTDHEEAVSRGQSLWDSPHPEKNSPATGEEPRASFAARRARKSSQREPVDPHKSGGNAEAIPLKKAPNVSGADIPRAPIDLPVSQASVHALKPNDTIRPAIMVGPVPGGNTNTSEVEKDRNTFIQSARSASELEPDGPGGAGWQGQSIPSKTDPNDSSPTIGNSLLSIQPAALDFQTETLPLVRNLSTLRAEQLLPPRSSSSPTESLPPEVIHPAVGMAHRPAAASQLSAVEPPAPKSQPLNEHGSAAFFSSARLMDRPALRAEPAAISALAADQARTENAERQSTPRASASLSSEDVHPLTRSVAASEKATRLLHRSPESNPEGVIQPPLAEAVVEMRKPFGSPRAMPQSEDETTPLARIAAKVVLPLLPMLSPPAAQSYSGEETRSSTPIHGSLALDLKSTIRPVIPAERPLGEKSQTSQTDVSQSTVSTVRLTIGRIVVKAGPPAGPAASRPVSTRRQPSVLLSDYLARHGRNK